MSSLRQENIWQCLLILKYFFSICSIEYIQNWLFLMIFLDKLYYSKWVQQTHISKLGPKFH